MIPHTILKLGLIKELTGLLNDARLSLDADQLRQFYIYAFQLMGDMKQPDRYFLQTESFFGDLHDAARKVNRLGFAEYVVGMHCSGENTVVVYRMPEHLVRSIRAENRFFRDGNEDLNDKET